VKKEQEDDWHKKGMKGGWKKDEWVDESGKVEFWMKEEWEDDSFGEEKKKDGD
jgi:hypothetical protein